MKKIILLSFCFLYMNVWSQTPQLFQNIHPNSGYQNGVANIYFGAVQNGKLYFNVADSATSSYSIYCTDGTVAGTTQLKTIPQIANFFGYNNEMYFGMVDVSTGGSQLWKTDGTVAGTQLVKVLGSNAMAPNTFTTINGKMIFVAGNPAAQFVRFLYVSDGTAAGTGLLSNAIYETDFYYGYINNKLLFSASANVDSAQQKELYITDGTSAGTSLLKDINPGILGSRPRSFTTMNNKVYFAATTSAEGTELWATDGTTTGTTLVADINPGAGNGVVSYANWGVFNNKLYFGGYTSTTGNELYASDGTAANTLLVKDINNGATGSNPSGFVEIAGKLMFICNNGINGSELWTTDGSNTGTSLFMDINAGAGSAVYSLMAQNLLCPNRLFFDADNGGNNIEPWVTDGTLSGTKKLAEINPTTTIPGSLDYETVYRKLNDKIYFKAFEPVNGNELYVMSDSCSTTGINPETDAVSVEIYPNPAKNNIHISMNTAIDSYEIYSIVGQKITADKYNEQPINTSNLASGNYFIKIITHQGQFITKKFLIE